MSATQLATAWDARVDLLCGKLPATIGRWVNWIREPSRVWVRMIVGPLFILGGVLSILPILGLWMLPVGLALIGQDLPGLKAILERSARWMERLWTRIRSTTRPR